MRNIKDFWTNWCIKSKNDTFNPVFGFWWPFPRRKIPDFRENPRFFTKNPEKSPYQLQIFYNFPKWLVTTFNTSFNTFYTMKGTATGIFGGGGHIAPPHFCSDFRVISVSAPGGRRGKKNFWPKSVLIRSLKLSGSVKFTPLPENLKPIPILGGGAYCPPPPLG